MVATIDDPLLKHRPQGFDVVYVHSFQVRVVDDYGDVFRTRSIFQTVNLLTRAYTRRHIEHLLLNFVTGVTANGVLPTPGIPSETECEVFSHLDP